MTTPRLSARALGRATLARQLLLDRQRRPVLDVVAHLVGLQAQEPQDPYTAFWSRVDGFDAEAVSQAMVDRSLVRIVLMRGTIHLVTAADASAIRPLVQPVLDAELVRHSEHGVALRTADPAPVVAFATAFLEEQPRTFTELRTAIAAQFPGAPAAALAYACRNWIPVVQVPPRGLWRRAAQVRMTPLASWVGAPPAPRSSIDDLVLRYFGAFGPAAVADVATWSRLTGLREVVDRLRPRLQVFADERGRELFDLPAAPRPDPDTPAPVRVLPQYDNALLSHADRSRFARPDAARLAGATAVHGTVLHDGTVVGVWHGTRARSTGVHTVTVEHLRVTKRAQCSIAAEFRRFLAFSQPDASEVDVQLVPLTR